MNVLFITSWYPTSDYTYGGIFVREYAKAARAAGNDVVVLHAAGPSGERRRLWKMEEELDPELREGIPAYHVYHRSLLLPKMSYPLYLWSVLRAFKRLRANGFKPDVIHAHVYAAGVPALMIGRRNGIPVVITEHFTGFSRRTLDARALKRVRRAYKNAARVLPVSVHLREAIEAYGIHGRFEVVPNVVDTTLFFSAKRRAGRDDQKRMIFVGNLEPSQHKGYPTLLEALTLLGKRRGDWRLDVIGEGITRPEYERLTEAADLAGPVVFHGAKPKREIAEMMRDSDLFVLPSRTETFGVVLAEALVSGLPIVSTTVGNIPDLVPSDAGVLVPPENAPELAGALDQVLSSLKSYDREGIAADARSRYSAEAVGRKLQTIYESVRSASLMETAATGSKPSES